MDVARRQINISTEPGIRTVDSVRADDDGESKRRIGVVEFLKIEIRMVDLKSQHGVVVCLVDDTGLAKGEEGVLEVPARREAVDVDAAVVDGALEAISVRREHGKIA